MMKRWGFYFTALLLSVLVLMGCQPETAVQDELKSLTRLPALPTVAPPVMDEVDPNPIIDPTSIESPAIAPTRVTHQGSPEALDAAVAGSKVLVNLAREELARQLKIPAEEISTVSVRAVIWPDASLGCPLPGIVYAQVQTPGYRIRLLYDGEAFEYHSDVYEQIIQCPADKLEGLPVYPVKPGDIDDGQPWMPVD